MKKIKLALLGCGYLNQIVANAVKDGIIPEYEIVGVMGRDSAKTQAVAEHYNTKACTSIDELMALEPDYVSEAASAEAVVDYTETILKGEASIIILSTGAFKDAELFEKLKDIAKEKNQKIFIAGGAVAGLGNLRTAALMSPIETTMTSKKWPGQLYYTPLYKEGLMDITEPERVYTGTAQNIVENFSNGFNVIMATALASSGPNDTKFNIDVVPNFRGEDYRIQVLGKEIAYDLNILSINYGIAGWSVVQILQNIASPVVF